MEHNGSRKAPDAHQLDDTVVHAKLANRDHHGRLRVEDAAAPWAALLRAVAR